MYGRVAAGGGRGAASGLWLEGRLCSMLTVMLGGDLDIATWIYWTGLLDRTIGKISKVGHRHLSLNMEFKTQTSSWRERQNSHLG